MEIATIFHKEYEVKQREDGTLTLKPIIRPSDKRNALKEYSTQELVDEVWRRCEEELESDKERKELWKNIVVIDEGEGEWKSETDRCEQANQKHSQNRRHAKAKH